MKKSSDRTWKGKVKLIIFSILPMLILFGIVELYASLMTFRSQNDIHDELTGLRYHEMRIGRLPWRRTSITHLNSLGYGDDEFVNILPKGDCIHVVFSGDSFTFGEGINDDKRLFSIIKRWSSLEHTNRCIRFFNIAQIDTTIDQQILQIQKTFPLLKPDMVILGQYQNDLFDLAKKVTDNKHQKSITKWKSSILNQKLTFNLAIVKYLSYHVVKFMIKHDIHYEVSSRSVFEDSGKKKLADDLVNIYREHFSSLVKELHEKSVKLGVLIFPSKFDLLAGRSPEESFFINLALKHDLPYLKLLPALESSRAEYPFLLYDGHYNEQGNYVTAKAVHQWLFKSIPPPFEKLR